MTDKDKIAEQLRTAEVRIVRQSMFAACPHAIMLLKHYREDGTCYCNDKTKKEMREWGYKWKDGQWR